MKLSAKQIAIIAVTFPIIAYVNFSILRPFFSSNSQNTWNAAQIENARLIFASKRAHKQAIKTQYKGHSITRANQWAAAVSDPVLDLIHKDFRQHWREEYQEGLKLFMQGIKNNDIPHQIEGQMLLDRFANWWNANKARFKIPKNIRN